MINQIDRIKEKERFQDRFGIRYDLKSNEYTNLWLKGLYPNLPVPDIRHWWRDPGLYLPLSLAIARDSSSNYASIFPGTSLTYALNNAAGNLALIGIAADGDDVVNAVSYNAVACTLIVKIELQTSGTWIYVYGLGSPATGNHNVVILTSSSVGIQSLAASYSGTNASTTMENTGSGSTNFAFVPGFPLIVGLTSSTNNAWGFGCFYGNSAGSSSVNSNFVSITASGGGGTFQVMDTNAAITPAGAHDFTGEADGNAMAMVGCIFAPAGGATGWGPLLGLQRNRIINVSR